MTFSRNRSAVSRWPWTPLVVAVLPCAGCLLADADENAEDAEYGAAPTSQCRDGIDNDGDGKIDWPSDPGCANKKDNSEANTPPPPQAPECSDGVNNDGSEDSLVDYPADPGCSSASDDSEAGNPADPPPTTAVGPSAAITCPAGSVNIAPGSSIQAAVDANPSGTSFCLGAGVFAVTGAVTPKSGDSFTGSYGAILDGSGWTTSDNTQGAFRSWNQDIDNVTIRNIVFRNMPQRAISAFYWMSDGWIIESNEMTTCQVGMVHGNYFQVRQNYIHHNRQYGIGGYLATGALIENNELAYNPTQPDWPGDMGTSKWAGNKDLTVRGNYVHHSAHHGIWLDGSISGNLVENNTVTDNAGMGIFIEVTGQTVVRNNQVERSGAHGLYISNAREVEAYGNTFVRSGGVGIALFLDGQRVSGGNDCFAGDCDLINNYIHDNTVDASDTEQYTNHLAAAVSCSNVTDGCAAAADTKNNRFVGNTYDVPGLTTPVFYFKEHHRTWSEWQGSGKDVGGSAY